MKISEEFYTREFKSKISKDAYLLACEWVAKNVISKNSKVEVSKVSWNIAKVEGQDLPTFKLSLFITYEEEEVNAITCKLCKEMHSAFFINENYNCNRCNKEAYRRRMKDKLSISGPWFREQISKMLHEF